MPTTQTGTRIALRNILYLTDFSPFSDAAIPLLKTIASEYQSEVHALHVLLPVPLVYAAPTAIDAILRGQEEGAQIEMKRVASQFAGVPCKFVIEHGTGVWPSVERAMERYNIDLIVLGTHGRTGAPRLLLGSIAEEIFRRAPVPVITVGPMGVSPHLAKLHRVLFATDFTVESLAAAPYAVSLAEENEAHLTLLHVKEGSGARAESKATTDSPEAAIRDLLKLVPTEAECWCVPEALVRYGHPADQILEVAKEQKADLIVMGVRSAAGHLGAAIHLERPIAHKVVTYATCPVLTVRA